MNSVIIHINGNKSSDVSLYLSDIQHGKGTSKLQRIHLVKGFSISANSDEPFANINVDLLGLHTEEVKDVDFSSGVIVLFQDVVNVKQPFRTTSIILLLANPDKTPTTKDDKYILPPLGKITDPMGAVREFSLTADADSNKSELKITTYSNFCKHDLPSWIDKVPSWVKLNLIKA